MTTFIVNTFHRGKKLPVLLKKNGETFHVVDINGYDPKSFPKNVGFSALKKVMPKAVDIPTVNISPQFDLSDFSL